jgi:hypothetical protein
MIQLLLFIDSSISKHVTLTGCLVCMPGGTPKINSSQKWDGDFPSSFTVPYFISERF